MACYSTVHKRGLLLPFTILLPIPESFLLEFGVLDAPSLTHSVLSNSFLSDLASAHNDATPMSPPLQYNSLNHLNKILQHRPFFLFTNKNPSTTKTKKKGVDSPPNHESGRASKLSNPFTLSLFSPFLRSSRGDKNLTNFSSFSALHSIALVAFFPPASLIYS